jgi:hypothetical protein
MDRLELVEPGPEDVRIEFRLLFDLLEPRREIRDLDVSGDDRLGDSRRNARDYCVKDLFDIVSV